ncbi:MAG: 5'-methylthioadenosine phosphorylase, partial [Pseudomonadota bacterium]
MLAIIGGTGLYAIDGLETVSEAEIETPFGKPS